jgi:hypothetical protein
MDMTDRTCYTGVRPGVAAAPTVQKDRLVEQMGGTHGPAASRARIDTVALRLQRLGQIIDEHDWEQLREWRLSQMMALGFFEQPE